MLLISLLTDLPLVAISTDAVGNDELERPSRYNSRAVLSISLVLGTLTALAEIAFFLTLAGQTGAASQTSMYLFLSFTQLVVIASVRNQDHFWKAVAPSRPLLAAMLVAAVITLAIPSIRPLARLFGFVAPSLAEVGVVLLGSLLYLLVLDLVKVWYYRTADADGVLHAPRWLSWRGEATSPS